MPRIRANHVPQAKKEWYEAELIACESDSRTRVSASRRHVVLVRHRVCRRAN